MKLYKQKKVLHLISLSTSLASILASIYNVSHGQIDIFRILLLVFVSLSGLLAIFDLFNAESLTRELISQIKQSQSNQLHNESRATIRLLKSIFPSDEQQENIIGDLLEEFAIFESKPKAYLWLYKQVLKSVLPLIFKNVKGRLASYFGERIR